MAYTLVPVEGPIGCATYEQGAGLTDNRYWLISAWAELKPDASGLQIQAIGFDPTIGPFPPAGAFRGVTINLTFPTDTSPRVMSVGLGNDQLYSIGGGATSPYFAQVGFNMDALVAGVFYNILISIDSVSNILQCYVNDAALVPVGTPAWRDTTPISEPFAGAVGSPSGGTIDILAQNNFTSTNPCVADLFMAQPASFFDLTVTANRRQFINADLTPVDLGSTGQNPLGATPPIFHHISFGQHAATFLPNLGTVTGTTFTTSGFGSGPFQLCNFVIPIPTPFCGDVHTTTSFTAAWTTPGPADFYVVQWRKVGDEDFTTIADITDLFVLITGLAPATTYEFKVEAEFDSMFSGFSALVQCSTLETEAPPTGGGTLCGWRGSCGINWHGLALVGDKFSNVVGLSDFTIFTEYGNQMQMLVTAPPLHQDRKRIFIPRFEIEVEAGLGIPGSPEVAPLMQLDYSKDGGVTWVNLLLARSMGKAGEYIKRLRWLNLGESRTWVFRLRYSDSARPAIIGTYVDEYKGLG